MRTSIRLSLIGVFIHAATAVIQFPFGKHANTGHNSAASLIRRAVNTDIFWSDLTYVVNASIGTPGQSVSLVLSPSSSDTWVIDARSEYCTSYDYSSYVDDDTSSISSCVWGTFSTNLSSSYKLQDSSDNEDSSYGYSYDFDVSYDDGTYAYGNYFNDVITLGGAIVSNFTLGLVNETNMYIGVLGIGYNDSTYSNLPNRLQQQGLINSTAYSIWVDDERASSGNLLFGAIDTAKIDGNLTRVSSYNSYSQLTVEISSINGTTSDSSGPISITYTDSDSTYSYSSSYLFTATFSPPDTISNLPTEVASQIWDIAGAYYDSNVSFALISCTAASDTTANFTLQLGQGIYGPIITATMADLVIPADEFNMTNHYAYHLDDDDDVCLFGVQNGSTLNGYSSAYNLGSTLLRRTYSVFDLVNNEVAVAPVRFGATATSNIVPFATYGASVPSSTLHCIYSSCYETTSDGTDDGSGSADGGGLPAGILSVPALVGMSLGIGLGALALGLVGFFVWSHRWNKKMAGREAAAWGTSADVGEMPPLLSGGNPASEPGAAPEMAEAAVAPAVVTGKGKGKAPETALPEALDPVEERPETSGTAEAGDIHDADAGRPSSGRGV